MTVPPPSTIGHLDALFADAPADHHIAITRKAGRRWETEFFRVADRDRAAAHVAAMAPDHDVYVRMTTLASLPGPGRRGGAEHSGALTAVWADLDVAGPGHAPAALPHPPTIEATRAIADGTGLKPSLVIASGGGLYAIWLLDEPWLLSSPDERAEAGRFLRRWVHGIAELGRRRHAHIDAGVGELARVLRPPGSWNHKIPRQPRRVELIDAGDWPTDGILTTRPWRPGPRYSVAELEAAVVEPPPPPQPAAARAPARPSTSTRDGYGPADAVAEAMTWAEILTPHGWRLVGHESVGGRTLERWLRPGDPSSDCSAKADPDGALVVWSDSVPELAGGGVGHSKWATFVAFNFGGDATRAGREIRAAARARSAA